MSANRSQIHSPLTGYEVADAIALRAYHAIREALTRNGQFTNHVTFVGVEFVAGIKVKGWMRKEIKVLATFSEGKSEGDLVEVEAEAVQTPVSNPTEVRETLKEPPRGPSLTDLLAESADYGGTLVEEVERHEQKAEQGGAEAQAGQNPAPQGVEGVGDVDSVAPPVAPVADTGDDSGPEAGAEVVDEFVEFDSRVVTDEQAEERLRADPNACQFCSEALPPKGVRRYHHFNAHVRAGIAEEYRTETNEKAWRAK